MLKKCYRLLWYKQLKTVRREIKFHIPVWKEELDCALIFLGKLSHCAPQWYLVSGAIAMVVVAVVVVVDSSGRVLAWESATVSSHRCVTQARHAVNTLCRYTLGYLLIHRDRIKQWLNQGTWCPHPHSEDDTRDMTTSERMVYRNPYHGYSDTEQYGAYNNNNNNNNNNNHTDTSKGSHHHHQSPYTHTTQHYGHEEWTHANGYNTTQVRTAYNTDTD